MNMESKEESTAAPPSYHSIASTPYPTMYPPPANEPGTTSYPPPGQYPSPSQYPPPSQQYPTEQAPYGQSYGHEQPQPQAGYSPQQRYGTPQYFSSPPKYQQQQVLFVGAEQPQPIITQHVQSYVGNIIFACVVFWCCNWLFGLIAFILAMMASSTAVSDPAGARRLGNASVGMSIAGIVISVIIVVVVVAVVVGSGSCPYLYAGTCYQYRTYSYYYTYCPGLRSGYYCYYD